MSDSMELQSAYTEKEFIPEAYHKVEYKQLTDQNNLTYNEGRIKFSTESVRADTIVLSDSHLAIPLNFASSTATAYTGDTKLAFKNSVLSLIYGSRVSTTNGTQLYNEADGSSTLVNNLRLLTKDDIDLVEFPNWQTHFYGPDRRVSGGVGRCTSTNTSGLPSGDFSFNVPLTNRINCFYNQCANTDVAQNAANLTNWQLLVFIPLKYLHPFFAAMHFPAKNLSLRIDFFVNGIGAGQQSFMPIQCPTAAATASSFTVAGDPAAATAVVAAAVTQADAPVITINTSVNDRSASLGACQLFLKTVKLRADDEIRFNEQIARGWKKEVTFANSQMVIDGEPVTKTTFNQVLNPTIVRPNAIWILLPPVGSRTAVDNGFPGHIGCAGPVTTKGCALMYNTQIKIAGANFFDNTLTTQMQHYLLLKDKMPERGALLSYDDYVYGGINPYYFDISAWDGIEGNQAVSLAMTSTIQYFTQTDGGIRSALTDPSAAAGVPKFELIAIVESLKTIKFDFRDNVTYTEVYDGAPNVKA